MIILCQTEFVIFRFFDFFFDLFEYFGGNLNVLAGVLFLSDFFSSGGVMELLDMIIADAKRTEDEMQASEQKTQAEYGSYVAATTASIEADREAIAENEKQVASTKSEKSETEEAQLANQASLDKLAELLSGLHGQCDFILKYFDIRQTSRAEEMDAIGEAKAILSGADFS